MPRRIRQSVELGMGQVAQTANVAESLLAQVGANGLHLVGRLSLELPQRLAVILGHPVLSVQYDLLVRLADSVKEHGDGRE